MLTMYVIAGVFAGWLFPELMTAVARGNVTFPIGLNIMAAFVGGVVTYGWLS